jgi:hypothetical protein
MQEVYIQKHATFQDTPSLRTCMTTSTYFSFSLGFIELLVFLGFTLPMLGIHLASPQTCKDDML